MYPLCQQDLQLRLAMYPPLSSEPGVGGSNPSGCIYKPLQCKGLCRLRNVALPIANQNPQKSSNLYRQIRHMEPSALHSEHSACLVLQVKLLAKSLNFEPVLPGESHIHRSSQWVDRFGWATGFNAQQFLVEL